MGTYVTLAEILEARSSPLGEEEIWCLLLATTEALLDLSKNGSGTVCGVLNPGSVLLSANGSLAFKSCARYKDVASFTAPEVQQCHAASRTIAEKMVAYSLGMTFYWCIDYHLPQNQPVQLSAELESLLLSMCEDLVVRRTNLLTVFEVCELHHKASMLPPAERVIRQLVEDFYRSSVDHGTIAENGSQLTDRSQMVRDRLHGGSFSYFSMPQRKKIFSGASYTGEPTGIPSRHREGYSHWQHLIRGPCSPYSDANRNANSRSISQFDSTSSLNEKKLQDVGPEFIRMLEEPLVELELPGSIVSKKGKSATTQRELSVVMPNTQSILVRCEVKSRGRDVFDMIVAHSNLMEHFYFGLAYIYDNEFFFVDNDTKISKVAPDSWKKVPTTTFVLYFRVKFFVSDISLLLHKQTRHQYYLQLRRDLLEDRLSCHDETALYLGALALQAEYGDCMTEIYGRNFYRPDQYVPKSVMEKRALPYIQAELMRLHLNNAKMQTGESELEFLKVCQQLPEYGLLFYHVTREKKFHEGELVLGVCAKGVIVYDVKDGCRSTSQTFYWRETATISSNRRKFVIENRTGKKKNIFVTERSRIAKYLCNLCSAQHKFNNEMNSRQLTHSLVSEENIMQYAVMCQAQSSRLKSFSCSETPQDDSGLVTPQEEHLTKLCDDVSARMEACIKQQSLSLNEQSTCSSSQRSSIGMRSPACSQRSGSEAPSGSPAPRETPTKLGSPSEREVLCFSLKKDPKLGLGIMIVGEDTVGHFDLGIFVASIVPNGPADRDGRIRPGGRLISLNHISLEGRTFHEAAEVMQSSPEEVQLIISQQKGLLGFLRNAGCVTQVIQCSLDLNGEFMQVHAGTRITLSIVPPFVLVEALEEEPKHFNRFPSSFWPDEMPKMWKRGPQTYLISTEPTASAGACGVDSMEGSSILVHHSTDPQTQTTSLTLYQENMQTLTGTEYLPPNTSGSDDFLSLEEQIAFNIFIQIHLSFSPGGTRSPVMRNYEPQTIMMADGRSGDDSPDEIVSITMTPKTSNRLHVPGDVRLLNAQDSNTLQPTVNCGRSEDILLELKKVSGSLGISISGGVNSNLPDGRIYIRSLVPGGAADRAGSLRAGDVLLEVDGISFQGISYHQAVGCLSKTGEVVNLLVERELMNSPRVSISADTSSSVSNRSISPSNRQRRTSNFSSISVPQGWMSERLKDYRFVTEENTQEVTLVKSTNGLGFSFIMCELDPPLRDFGCLVRIKELFPGQPAQQSGRIKEGDILLAINGQCLKELSYPRVLKLFKTSPPEVRLTLCRTDPGILPSIDELIGT